MVDTINPMTGKSDQDPNNFAVPNTANTNPSFQPASDGFYSGFNKPNEVQVNLAATEPTNGVRLVSAEEIPNVETPKFDSVNSPGVSQEYGSQGAVNQAHATATSQSFNSSSSSPLQMILIVLGAIVFVILVAVATNLITKNIYQKKVDVIEEELNSTKLERDNQITPDALQLPVVKPVPESDVSVSAPEQTTSNNSVINTPPVTTTVPPSPATDNSGNG